MNRSKLIPALMVVCFAIVLIVSGCGRIELYQNLSEDEANDILVLLSENNIKAIKKKVVLQNEVSYSLEVRDADMVKSRSLLVQHNLPRRKELGLTGVYKEKGLIPTPDEQKARYLLALKGEIINSLQRIPQIVSADVVLNVPTKDEFGDAERQKQLRPTASVVIRSKPDISGIESVTEPKIQQFVANSVEGMNPRDVTVIISYITGDEKALRPGDVRTLPTEAPGLPPPAAVTAAMSPSEELMGLKLDSESKDRLKVYLLIFFLLLVVISAALIIFIVQGSRVRRTLAALQGPAGGHPAIEGHILDEGSLPRLGGGTSDDEL
ncbi:MAG: hypothetical protein V2A66_09930 [Pseudomonadota bacterium]